MVATIVEQAREDVAEGKAVALVTDAGTPGLSDPGARVIASARRHGHAVIPVPGPSSLTAALSVSAMNGQRFLFAGFLPPRPAERRKTLQAHYVPLEPSRSDHDGQPSVVALPVPEPYSQRYVTGRQIEQSLPDAVGAFVAWLLNESRWTVTERFTRGDAVPIEARHICLLFRRFLSYGSDVTRPYVDALEARGVRHLLVGGRTFHNREEIETLRAALMAIEWPDDQLSAGADLGLEQQRRGCLRAIHLRGSLGGQEGRRLASDSHRQPEIVAAQQPPAVRAGVDPRGTAVVLRRQQPQRAGRKGTADDTAAFDPGHVEKARPGPGGHDGFL